jgi:hypothetical protein
MSISINVLGLPVPDVPALVAWILAARPAYAVVMDSVDIATRIRMASPDTQIIFRRYRPDDAKLHETTSPTEFLDSVSDLPRDFIVQALNEPGGDQAQLANWCAALIRLADQRGRRLALPNWSVGNPDDEAVAGGLYDPLWRAMAESGRHHVLGLHEYALIDPASEPWHVGRYRNILRRFDALGLKRPAVVMTEHGRDLAGGRDGWRAVFNEQDYAAFLDTAQETYKPDGVCACVFCYGSGFEGRWASYDVQGAPDLLVRMSAMNAGNQEAEVVPWGLKKVQTKSGKPVNMRAEPKLTAPIIRTVITGDYLRPYGTPVAADSNRWQRVNDENCRTGWVSLNVLELV